SAAIWIFWPERLARLGWAWFALDLRGHGASAADDLAATTMADHADDVAALVRQLAPPPVLMGWSMGGLVALLAAARGSAEAWIGLAPSPPARTRGGALPLRGGTFGAEEDGIVSADPADQPTMPDLDLEERAVALGALAPESRLARDDRKAGIVITGLSCPALIVAGPGDVTFPPPTYADVPFAADRLEAAGASHWGLVLNRRVLATLVPAVCAWLEKTTSARPAPSRQSKPCG
ncbi:MAG: alpha/beta hydrolase, partial [Candidatus Rokuibacteriota bacterium]